MILVGDCREQLKTLPSASVHCVLTSPPYYGLRDYGEDSQIGLETTPNGYVDEMVSVFAEVRRVLRDDGVCWLNLGDSYVGGGNSRGNRSPLSKKQASNRGATGQCANHAKNIRSIEGLKRKDLIGVPWKVAFALQADGWYLRSDIIFYKPNAMPESITDRPTKAHEYVFLLSKSEDYWYDHEAIKEPATTSRWPGIGPQHGAERDRGEEYVPMDAHPMRNARTVWSIPTTPFPGAHFATMAPELARRCILAGCPSGGTVLDPFFGAGTTGLVASRLGRSYIGIELNESYARLAQDRIAADAPLFHGIENDMR